MDRKIIFDVYKQNLINSAYDKIDGKFNKNIYNVNVELLGLSLGISKVISRKNFNSVVRSLRYAEATGDDADFDIKIN